MAKRGKFLASAFIVVGCFVGLIPPSSASSVPSQCSKFVSADDDTIVSVTVTDFLGNIRSSFGVGENVHVNAIVENLLGGDTNVNRVRFVWFDPAGALIQAPLLPRGQQSSSDWGVTGGLTASGSGSANPFGTWTVILCYETPNNTKGRGVTHHVDVAIYSVV